MHLAVPSPSRAAPAPRSAARPAPRPDEDAPAVVLSPAGVERAAAIQAALARLSAAVPGYVAAVESLGALRGLGIEVSIDDDARAEWANA